LSFFIPFSTLEILSLSLHDALPISRDTFYPWNTLAVCKLPSIVSRRLSSSRNRLVRACRARCRRVADQNLPAPSQKLLCRRDPIDRKSTRLNSSHQISSYARSRLQE